MILSGQCNAQWSKIKQYIQKLYYILLHFTTNKSLLISCKKQATFLTNKCRHFSADPLFSKTSAGLEKTVE